MNDQERLDDLIIDGLQLYQPTDMFRFSLTLLRSFTFAILTVVIPMLI